MKERPIKVDGKGYTWVVGRGNVVIRDEDRKSTVVEKRLILGLSHDDMERLPWKSPGCEALAVTPAKIAAFIKKGAPKERKIAERAEASCCGDTCDYDADDSDPCGGKVDCIDEVYDDKTGDCYWTHMCRKHQGKKYE